MTKQPDYETVEKGGFAYQKTVIDGLENPKPTGGEE